MVSIDALTDALRAALAQIGQASAKFEGSKVLAEELLGQLADLGIEGKAAQAAGIAVTIEEAQDLRWQAKVHQAGERHRKGIGR